VTRVREREYIEEDVLSHGCQEVEEVPTVPWYDPGVRLLDNGETLAGGFE